MHIQRRVMSIFLTIVCANTALAQGLNFSATFDGKVIVSEPTNQSLQVDFFGDAARRIYEHLQQEPGVEKLVGRNPKGEVVEDVLRNSKIMCSSSRRVRMHICQMQLVR